MKGPLASALLLALVGVSMPALAADRTVTFQVPVKLEKLDPQVTGFLVTCTIFGDLYFKVANNISPTLPVQNGAYTGVLSVPLTVPESDVGKVKTWACGALLIGPGGMQSTINAVGHPWTKALPGSVVGHAGTF